MLLGLIEPLACLLQLKLELDMQESLVVRIAVHGGGEEVLLKLLEQVIGWCLTRALLCVRRR